MSRWMNWNSGWWITLQIYKPSHLCPIDLLLCSKNVNVLQLFTPGLDSECCHLVYPGYLTSSMSGMAVGICAVQLKQSTSIFPGPWWRSQLGLSIISSEYWLQHVEASSLLNPKVIWSTAIDTRLFLRQNSDSRSV